MRVLILAICGFSLFIIKSIKPDVFALQLAWVVLGFLVFILISKIDSSVFKSFWPLFYIISLVFLFLALFGPEVRGAKRWIEVFSWRIQPSEIVKPFLIVSWAGFLSSAKKKSLSAFLKYLAIFLLPFILVFKQPDLGNSLVYLSVFLILLFASGFRFLYLTLPLTFFFLTLPLLWPHLAQYQRLRIVSFLNPHFDVAGAGYNSLQSLIAVGSGGIFGRGIGGGTQSRLRFLPEFHTDFIFASTVEQLGFVGGAALLLLYFFLLWQVLVIGKENGRFQYLLSFGVFAQIFIQVFVNVGMNLGLLPITGITLPLFSFGGSSLLATFLGLGIIFASSRKKREAIAIR